MNPKTFKELQNQLDEALKKKYEKCFLQHGHTRGDDFCFCLGAPGGSPIWDFVNEDCLRCPYFTIYIDL